MSRDPIWDPVTVVGIDDDGEDMRDLSFNSSFPEVDHKFLDPSSWKTSLMGKWNSEDSITLKEGRALVICVRSFAQAKIGASVMLF